MVDKNIQKYVNMQKEQYSKITLTRESAINLCVGSWDIHQEYPYEKYLLKYFNGRQDKALDFGCGIGRMMLRMFKYFDIVDGADMMQSNLNFAHDYLKNQKTNLFKTNGLGCEIENQYKYDFIYSTICLQHIPVYRLRKKILFDLFNKLSKDGSMCIQMGSGWDNGTYWNDNIYDAKMTNSGHDVSIPDKTHFINVEDTLRNIGFKNIKFEERESPHKNWKNYHQSWLFIYMDK